MTPLSLTFQAGSPPASPIQWRGERSSLCSSYSSSYTSSCGRQSSSCSPPIQLHPELGENSFLCFTYRYSRPVQLHNILEEILPMFILKHKLQLLTGKLKIHLQSPIIATSTTWREILLMLQIQLQHPPEHMKDWRTWRSCYSCSWINTDVRVVTLTGPLAYLIGVVKKHSGLCWAKKINLQTYLA